MEIPQRAGSSGPSEFADCCRERTASTQPDENWGIRGAADFKPITSDEFSEEEVSQHTSADSAWGIFEGKVYDLTKYIETGSHPGGNSVLMTFAGRDFTEAFRDTGHSQIARHLLDSFFIGYLKGTGSRERDSSQLGFEAPPVSHDLNFVVGGIDFRKPIVQQVWKLSKSEYINLASQYRCCTEPSQFFESEWLEMLSRTKWFVVPLVWIPVAIINLLVTKHRYDLEFSTLGWATLFGIFVWTLTEYLVHRFVFHFEEFRLPDYHVVRLCHFLMHEVHHLTPLDPMRLVMPPVLLTLLTLPIYGILSVVFPQIVMRSVLSGVLIGYVIYDMLHYAEHHAPLDGIGFLRWQKIYHMKHHYKYPLLAFGVSNPFWDWVFGTMI